MLMKKKHDGSISLQAISFSLVSFFSFLFFSLFDLISLSNILIQL